MPPHPLHTSSSCSRGAAGSGVGSACPLPAGMKSAAHQLHRNSVWGSPCGTGLQEPQAQQRCCCCSGCCRCSGAMGVVRVRAAAAVAAGRSVVEAAAPLDVDGGLQRTHLVSYVRLALRPRVEGAGGWKWRLARRRALWARRPDQAVLWTSPGAVVRSLSSLGRSPDSLLGPLYSRRQNSPPPPRPAPPNWTTTLLLPSGLKLGFRRVPWAMLGACGRPCQAPARRAASHPPVRRSGSPWGSWGRRHALCCPLTPARLHAAGCRPASSPASTRR